MCSLSVTSQGHPYARFKRALATRRPTIATAAAHELENVGLDDALRLVLLYLEAEDPRFERAALRWHARLCAETERLGLAGAGVSAQALIALGGREVRRGVEALSQLLEGAGLDRAVKALDEWTEGLDRG